MSLDVCRECDCGEGCEWWVALPVAPLNRPLFNLRDDGSIQGGSVTFVCANCGAPFHGPVEVAIARSQIAAVPSANEGTDSPMNQKTNHKKYEAALREADTGLLAAINRATAAHDAVIVPAGESLAAAIRRAYAEYHEATKRAYKALTEAHQ